MLSGFLLATTAGATVREVAPGELTLALREARRGDVLKLLPGIHRGAVEIVVPVSLRGEPGAIIEGNGTGSIVVVRADDVEISGLAVRGGGADLSQDDAAILLDEVRGGVVERCRVEARAFGIYLKAGGEHRIEDNHVIGDERLANARRGNGVHLWYSKNNQILGNELTSVRDGVYLSFAHENLISGNRGSGLRYGIHYMYSERNTLLGNRFHAGTGGIALMYSLDNHIEGNVTVGNQRFGILCQQLERSRLTANEVTGNGRGFYLENSANNHFESNLMKGNGVGTYLTAGSERNVFTSNTFDGNLVQVYRSHAGVNEWWDEGVGNSWSDYQGLDWNGDGVGDSPYRLETTSSALLARRPRARWFLMSPVLSLLDWWDARWATGRDATESFDRYPLVGGTALWSDPAGAKTSHE